MFRSAAKVNSLCGSNGSAPGDFVDAWQRTQYRPKPDSAGVAVAWLSTTCDSGVGLLQNQPS